MRIDGISSRKLDGGLEGSLKNNNLYNDKELWDDADLDWYDYGFRNYDAQIGRFTQLDPLTWDYPQYTPYQYAGNEPIANVDLDGMEPDFILNQLGIATGTMAAEKTLAPVVIKATLKTAPKAAKALNAINLGMNAVKIGMNVADHTQNLNTVENPNLPIYRYKPVLERINDWFRNLNGAGTIPVGGGSHQRVGIVFDGNDGATDNYTDKADNVVDNIHLGPLFKIMRMYKPSPTEAAITNETVKKVVNSADAASTAGENMYESVQERNETKVIRGSSGRQVSKTVWVIKYQIGPTGDTLGNSVDPVNIPVKHEK